MTKLISIIFGLIADIKFPPPMQRFINKQYIRIFNIKLSDFHSIESYESLNSLFTRGLKNIRKFNKDENIFISPCDGKITEYGSVDNNKALQIKGKSYKVSRLLDSNLDSNFKYVNLYLSPSNYHRYHSPCNMFIQSIIHFKGSLLPVHARSLNKNNNLFIRNERVVLKAIDAFGDNLYFVAVGALNVGRIIFYIESRLQDSYKGSKREFIYKDPIFVKKGEELGMFQMGSTIVLFAKNVDFIFEDSGISFGDSLFKKLEH